MDRSTLIGPVMATVIAGVLGCSGARSGKTTPPSVSAASSTPPPPAKVNAQPIDYENLPERFAKLGTACSATGPERVCRDGRIVAVRVAWDTAPYPTNARILVNDGDTDYVNRSLFIAVDRSVLYARRLICGHCRRQTGYAWVIDLDRLSASDGNYVLPHIFNLAALYAPATGQQGREEWLAIIEAELTRLYP